MKVLSTKNADWGFWGTVSLRTEPSDLWNEAFRQIKTFGGEGVSKEGVRFFLDSRYGRHFADTVLDGYTAGKEKNAISTAISEWAKKSASRKFVREIHAPLHLVGLPLLLVLLLWYSAQDDING